jgi:hypothetical protein
LAHKLLEFQHLTFCSVFPMSFLLSMEKDLGSLVLRVSLIVGMESKVGPHCWNRLHSGYPILN